MWYIVEKLIRLMVLLAIVGIGYFLVYKIANKKWGYTKRREEELEKENDIMHKKEQ